MLFKRLFIIGILIILSACSSDAPTDTSPEAQPTQNVTNVSTSPAEDTEVMSVADANNIPDANSVADAQLIAFYADIPSSRGEDGAFILGNPDAPITIIEFADFLCPHCQTYHDTIKQIIETYVVTGQVKIEYRFFPIIDENASPFLAALNECADQQGKFWATHSLLYDLAKNRALDQTVITTVADRLGMDANALTACMSGTGPFQFQIDYDYGRELSVNGTPAVRVQVGDNPVGVIKMGDAEYARGGVDLDTLTSFITSDNPANNVVLVNRLLVDNLLVDDSLISTDENCQLPCWRGITPGETTLTSAQEILEADDTIGNIEFQQAETRSGYVFSQVGRDRICCQVISDDGTTVSFISLQFTSNITLGQVMERYGEPAFSDAQLVTRDQALFTLFYPDVPMIIYVFAGLPSDVLSEDSPVIGMALPTHDIMDIFLSADGLPTWNGFISYDEAVNLMLMPEATPSIDVTSEPEMPPIAEATQTP
jgi:protein-disulfide isomerase